MCEQACLQENEELRKWIRLTVRANDRPDVIAEINKMRKSLALNIEFIHEIPGFCL